MILAETHFLWFGTRGSSVRAWPPRQKKKPFRFCEKAFSFNIPLISQEVKLRIIDKQPIDPFSSLGDIQSYY
jgi:hypothetical protein